ncbi:MAG: J domain-containing protein [Sphingomonas sp.]
MTCRPTRTSAPRFDRGEIDGDGNPTAPFGFGGGGRPGGFPPAARSSISAARAATSATSSKAVQRAAARRRVRERLRTACGAQGSHVAYRLAVPFADAARLAPQRITLQDGKTIDLKLPAGLEEGTQMRLAGKGEEGPGGFRRRDRDDRDLGPSFFARDGDDIRLDLPVSLSEAVLGAQVRVPTPEGAVMLTIPKGSTSGKVLRLKGRGFHRKDGSRGDLLVTLMVDVPVDDDALIEFVQGWQDRDKGNPRGRMGV